MLSAIFKFRSDISQNRNCGLLGNSRALYFVKISATEDGSQEEEGVETEELVLVLQSRV